MLTNISVFAEKIIENYDYYDDYDSSDGKKIREARSAIERFDALTRSRRDLENDVNSDSIVTYTVCVRFVDNLLCTQYCEKYLTFYRFLFLHSCPKYTFQIIKQFQK